MAKRLVLSPSGLSTWSTCRRKWFYTYKRGWRGRSSLAAAFGSALHSALDTVWLIATRKPHPELDNEDCVGFAQDSFDKTLSERWPRDIPEDEGLYLPALGHDIIREYVAEKWDKLLKFELIGCEEPLYIDYPEIDAALGGRVDKVYRDPKGQLILADQKTTKAGSGKAGIYDNFWSQFIVNRQIDTYLLAASKKWPDEHIGGLLIDAILVNRSARHYEARLFSRSPAELAAMEIDFKDAVRDIAEAGERGSFPRAMNDACTAYGGCQHRLLCSRYPDKDNLPTNPPAELADVLEVVGGTTVERLGLATGDKA